MICPTCKGFCCGSLYHDEWGSPPLRFGHVRPATHICPDCDDGTYEVCSDPEPFIPQRTAEDERADVLAWLRDVGTSASMSADEMVTLHWVARALYGMEHVGAAKRVKP